MTKPPYTYDEATKVVAETAKAPRITKEFLEDSISRVNYLYDGITTIAVIELDNGFKVIGHSTPASADNFNKEVGQSYAYDNAFRQLWPLYGFLLRQGLHDGGLK